MLHRRLCQIGLVGLVLTACEATGPSPSLTVSIRTQPTGPNASLAAQSNAAAPAISLAKLTLAGFQLSHAASCRSSADGCNEIEIRSDPVTVNLALDGTTMTLFTIPVAEGEYSRLQARLQAVEIQYTPSGAASPLIFQSAAGQEMDIDVVLDPVLKVTESGSSFQILIKVNTSAWFDDGNGGTLNPASTVGAAAIIDNVKKSLNAGELK